MDGGSFPALHEAHAKNVAITLISGQDRGSHLEMPDGTFFDPLNPDADLMQHEMLAVALGNMCRYGGLVYEFYSVAQHSVLVAALCPQDMPAQRMAILHDADEGFGLPDMPSPMKPNFKSYVDAQHRIGACVEARWGLDPADHDRIKPADIQALITEKHRLKSMVNEDYWRDWARGVEPATWLKIVPLQPLQARALFLTAFNRVFVQQSTREPPAFRPGEG